MENTSVNSELDRGSQNQKVGNNVVTLRATGES